MGLVATMTALLLGLVTAAAKGSFDSQDVAVRNAAAGMLTLDRLLARYGPEAAPTRALLQSRRRAAVRGARGRPAAPRRAPWTSSRSRPNRLPSPRRSRAQILQLPATPETRRYLKSEALKLTLEVLRTRWRVLEAPKAPCRGRCCSS